MSDEFKPNYIAIGFITLAALFAIYIAFRLYKWFTNKPLQPLDIALNHLNRKECLEALKLKHEMAEYKQDLQDSHPNIFRIGDRPGNINLADFTVVTPTKLITSSK